MPTAAETDRLQSVVARLQSLGNVQRGDLVTAQRWNDLVSVVTSLAQLMLEMRDDDTVPPHEHPDQVKLSWLDPALRALVEKGPTEPVKWVEVDHRVDVLERELATVRTSANDARDRLAEVSTRELVRDAGISEVRRVVETIDKRRDEVAELRRTFDSINAKVGTAIEASTRFVIDGQPVDMQAFDRRVRAVEDLRTSVQTSVTGFETRITDLQKSGVTQAQLDEAIRNRSVAVSPEQLAGIETNVKTSLRTEFNASFDALGTKIGRDVDDRLAGVDSTVGQRIDERLPAAIGPSIAGVKAQIDTTATQLRGETKVIGDQAAASIAAAKQELNTSIASVQSSLTAVKKDVDLTLPKVTELQTSVSTAQRDATSALQKTAAQAVELQATKARTEQVALQSNDAIKKTERSLLEEIDRRATTTKSLVDERIATFDAALDPRIDQRVEPRFTSLQSSIETTVTKTASDAAVAALASSRPQLDADIIRIARDQALALKDEVATQVKADVSTTINRSVTDAVRKANLGRPIS
ncbi:MAG TPA: hypothetical protein VNI54_01600 [Thermoanaerobaculia bacterium]|nr:hypothetical protein [Thermoanaerobaculia bacterium]